MRCGGKKNEKAGRMIKIVLNKIELICKKCNQKLNYDKFSQLSHIQKCVQKNMSCPLGCQYNIKSLEDGIIHVENYCKEALISC